MSFEDLLVDFKIRWLCMVFYWGVFGILESIDVKIMCWLMVFVVGICLDSVLMIVD